MVLENSHGDNCICLEGVVVAFDSFLQDKERPCFFIFMGLKEIVLSNISFLKLKVRACEQQILTVSGEKSMDHHWFLMENSVRISNFDQTLHNQIQRKKYDNTIQI